MKWHLLAQQKKGVADDEFGGDRPVGHDVYVRTVRSADVALRHEHHGTQFADGDERRPSMLVGRSEDIDFVINHSLAGTSFIKHLEDAVVEEEEEHARKQLEAENGTEVGEIVARDLGDPSAAVLSLAAMLHLIPEAGEGDAPTHGFRNVYVAQNPGVNKPLVDAVAVDAVQTMEMLGSMLLRSEGGGESRAGAGASASASAPATAAAATEWEDAVLELDFVSFRRPHRKHQPVEFSRFLRLLATCGIDDLDRTIDDPYASFLMLGRSSALTGVEIRHSRGHIARGKVRNTPAGRRAMCLRLATVGRACLRTLRELRRQMSSAGVVVTARQAALTMLCFPRYVGWTRVNVLVILFPYISDLHNIRRCCDALEGPRCVHEAASRLGWLAIFNPLRPAGYYHLNLAKHDERRLARMLLILRDTTEHAPVVVHRDGRLSTLDSDDSSSSEEEQDDAEEEGEGTSVAEEVAALELSSSRHRRDRSPARKTRRRVYASGLRKSFVWRHAKFSTAEVEDFPLELVYDSSQRWFKMSRPIRGADDMLAAAAWQPPPLWSTEQGAAIPHHGFLTVQIAEVRYIDAAPPTQHGFPPGRELLPLVLAATSIPPGRVCTAEALDAESAVQAVAHGARNRAANP
tara:strand:+ start:242 stop:2137 length:1896 start_codon:yes stop_codon:yes gene_type:complete